MKEEKRKKGIAAVYDVLEWTTRSVRVSNKPVARFYTGST
jgi:hypothetical protein